ncbi:lipopolysaccharide biosynthesis protein [Conexibacter sp. SYSU D00693]|uniref:lipopolysaccharide biosynthesis protein n=1 Tax=Conexibacter sp. SYSU D00693 TaxID=2812560 RepID=UPI00196A7B9E|nr:oligosaccharide flippase family protein [Conexibacter sp. SYSU D00693]
MGDQLRRLLAGSAAYQASSLLASALAVVTLPLYTAALSEAEYGYAETLLTAIILLSILLRLGLGEALVRFWFDTEEGPARVALARAATGWTFAATTAAAAVLLVFAGPLSEALLTVRDAGLLACGVLGLWAFTNLEVAYALLRVEERRGVYLAASCANVVLTVALTVVLVVVLDEGATGYVLGNYAASTVVLLGLWWRERRRIAFVPPRWQTLAPLTRYGGPTVPADAAVFALNVVDRAYLVRSQGAAAAGVYAVAVKLATVVIVAVRGFQAAWPPLAYSVTDAAEAGRLYARVTTAYVVVTGAVVCGVTLLGRWVVDLLADDRFGAAFEALPWVALGWALYGLYLVFVTIAGRAKATGRNLPAAAAGLVVNVVVLVLLVEPLGIAGAGIALCASYVVMLAVLHRLTRTLFEVPFERARLAGAVLVYAGVAVAGELLLPTDGLDGLALRVVALGVAAPLLVAARVVSLAELRQLSGAVQTRVRRR